MLLLRDQFLHLAQKAQIANASKILTAKARRKLNEVRIIPIHV